MRPNSEQLALRDPALAAIIGIVPSNFGGESDFGAEFGDDDYGVDDDYGAEFGDDDDYGAEFGAAAKPVKVPRPANNQQMVQLWKNVHAKKAMAKRREMLLEP